MINISQAAQEHFLDLLKEQEQGTNIKVFVINGGTANAECGVSYCAPDAINKTDVSFEYNGFLVYIAQDNIGFLEEAEIDLVHEEFGSQLTLKAPNSKAKKLPKDASLHERLEYFIQNTINPNLASHNGYINLVEITAENAAVIEFGGGCNGCSMVDVTLKDGIEKQILELFDGEIMTVKDVTSHARGEHSYY